MRVPGIGGPRTVLRAAIVALGSKGLEVEKQSTVLDTVPLGPSARNYANAAAIVATDHDPPAMLALLQRIEHAFGRRRRGQRWRARPLDLDIVLWSGGTWKGDALSVPHPAFRSRDFVLGPAAQIVPRWRDPSTGVSLRQLHTRLTRPRPLPR